MSGEVACKLFATAFVGEPKQKPRQEELAQQETKGVPQHDVIQNPNDNEQTSRHYDYPWFE
jgi:hypothetical protein